MKTPFPDRLVTARLILRRLQRGDAESLHGYRSLPEVARYQGWSSFGMKDAERLVDSQLDAEVCVPGTWFQVAIVEAVSGIVIGDCGLHCRHDDPRQMEIGITLSPRYQRRGCAAEAIGAVLAFLFGRAGMHRVHAVTDAKNTAAAALFRRLGFRQEAHFVEHVWYKGGWGSEFLFALLRREWEARREGTGQE